MYVPGMQLPWALELEPFFAFVVSVGVHTYSEPSKYNEGGIKKIQKSGICHPIFFSTLMYFAVHWSSLGFAI